MRICVVTKSAHGIGGLQDHSRLLARGLAAAGHDVAVIAGRHPEGVPEEEHEGAVWRFVDVPAHHPRLPRRHPEWFRCSYETFRELHAAWPFDVVHSESTSALELVRRGVHRTVPVVVKFHGNYVGAVRAAVRRARRGDAATKLREAKRIVWATGYHLQRGEWHRFRPCEWMVPSREQFDLTWRESFLKPSRGHVVPNGIDTQLFRPRPRSQARAELGLDDRPLFVCAGRLERGKGTHHAIRALALLGDEAGAPTLAIVGAGEERDRLEALARSLGLGSRVLFAGPQRHQALALYLAAADAFLFPTELDEAGGLVALQAMACGAPLIASSVGCVPEIVDRSGENGLLVTPGDAGALASAMRMVLLDRVLQRRLGEAGRERVLAEYTVERMVQRTVEVYEVARGREWRAAT